MKLYFLVLFFVASLCLSAQETSKIELSTEEKREDFEMFLSIMKSVNPQLTLRKKVLYDYFHDNVEIPVEISVEQVVKNFNNYNPDRVDKYIYTKDFLYNHDPVFRKVLKMK